MIKSAATSTTEIFEFILKIEKLLHSWCINSKQILVNSSVTSEKIFLQADSTIYFLTSGNNIF
ncbi:hypothetical protein [Calothrix sp. 336/3]|uniref:hypothetical protein n=1 Tax=Calothrix sp. 336/3 TaxID=1337936 RepID=UPI0004E31F29|nr:hypothetical protein [Calothrix sp. 336/3]AKG22406.1 hypothetical protein IJ00_15020 [Calothrix sp. 336/3]